MAIGLARSSARPEEEVPAPEVKIAPRDAPVFPMTPVMPRRASVREMIDSPNTLSGIENMYRAAEPSFIPAQQQSAHLPELMNTINTDGDILGYVKGGANDSLHAQHDSMAIPKDNLGIVHTHPYGLDPRPSADDENAATKIGRPNYEVSRDAIWVAEPGNPKPRKVANLKYKGGHLQYDWQPVPIPEPGK